MARPVNMHRILTNKNCVCVQHRCALAKQRSRRIVTNNNRVCPAPLRSSSVVEYEWQAVAYEAHWHDGGQPQHMLRQDPAHVVAAPGGLGHACAPVRQRACALPGRNLAPQQKAGRGAPTAAAPAVATSPRPSRLSALFLSRVRRRQQPRLRWGWAQLGTRRGRRQRRRPRAGDGW